MLRQYNEAFRDSCAASRLDPTLIKARVRAAKCCMHLGNLDEAQKQLKEVGVVGRRDLAVQKEVSFFWLIINL